ncbi:hypothetical protein LTR17_019206 [Elasticomyces elasticus]|nr:hypothetical protein LTR17_019206 [Elasticomyces elasticus]
MFQPIKFTVEAGDEEATVKTPQGNIVTLPVGGTGLVLELDGDFFTAPDEEKYVRVRMDRGDSNGDGVEGWTEYDPLDVGTGWPYVATKAWDPERAAQKSSDPAAFRSDMDSYVELRKYDEGKILGYTSELSWAQISIPRRNVSGWVPASNIQPGIGAKYGDITVVNNSALDDIDTDVETGTQSSPTGDIIYALLTVLDRNAHAVPDMEDWAKRRINNSAQRQWLTNEVVNGYKRAGTLKIFDDYLSTLPELRSAAKGPAFAVAGLYEWLNAQRTDGGPTAVYSGSSTDLERRMKQYSDPKSKAGRGKTHQAVYDSALEALALLICDLPHHDLEVLHWAEQITFLLMGNYIEPYMNAASLKHDVKIPKSPARALHDGAIEIADNARDIGVDEDDDEYVDDVQPGPGDEDPLGAEDPDSAEAIKRRKGAKYSVMKASAVALIKIASEVFDHFGYTPMTQREDFGGSQYGEVVGLNMQSPICAGWAKPIWTKTAFPAEKVTLYRRVITIYKLDATSYKFALTLRGNKAGTTSTYQQTFSVPNAHFGEHPPDAGDRIYLVCEVLKNGRHPRSYPGLPTVVLYDDDILAESLALRLEWYQNSQWWCMYVPDAYGCWRESDTEPGAIGAMFTAVGILNSLERTIVRSDKARLFDVVFSVPRIIEVSFDNLTQQVRIVEDRTPVRSAGIGQKRTTAVLKQMLRAAGATTFKSDGRDPKVLGTRQHPRYSCDRTALPQATLRDALKGTIQTEAVGNMAYQETHDPDCCVACAKHGIPCTFTPTAVLKTNVALQLALWAPTTKNKLKWQAMPMPDPQLENSMTTLSAQALGMLGISEDISEVDVRKIGTMYKAKTIEGKTELLKYLTAVAFGHMDLAKYDGAVAWSGLSKYANKLDRDVEGGVSQGAEWVTLRDRALQMAGEVSLPYKSTSFKDAAGNYIQDRPPSSEEVTRAMEGGAKNMGKDKLKKCADYLMGLAHLYGVEKEEAQALGELCMQHIPT